MTKKNPPWGTTLDTLLTEDGIREAAKAEAVTRVVAWQLQQEMDRQGISKAQLAERSLIASSKPRATSPLKPCNAQLPSSDASCASSWCDGQGR